MPNLRPVLGHYCQVSQLRPVFDPSPTLPYVFALRKSLAGAQAKKEGPCLSGKDLTYRYRPYMIDYQRSREQAACGRPYSCRESEGV